MLVLTLRRMPHLREVSIERDLYARRYLLLPDSSGLALTCTGIGRYQLTGPYVGRLKIELLASALLES